MRENRFKPVFREPLPDLPTDDSSAARPKSTSGQPRKAKPGFLRALEQKDLAASTSGKNRNQQKKPKRSPAPPVESRPARWLGLPPFFLIALCTFTLITGTSVGIGVAWVNQYLEELPEISYLETYSPNMPSRVFAGNDTNYLIADFVSDNQNREYIPFLEIPPNLRNAVVALEDRRFYEHSGICLPSVFRAVYHDIKTWSREQGASTISIQLAEDLINSGQVSWDMPTTEIKDFERKFWEWKLALQIEKNYTKEEILEFYLNQVFLGDQAYGVARAAEHYFGKRVQDLSLKECALFAGMLQSPNRYKPTRHPERAQMRTAVVLKAMARDGYITQEQRRQAEETPFQLKSSNVGRTQIAEYPYYSWAVHREFRNGEIRTKEGQEILIEGAGIDIISSIDTRLQEAAEKALRAGIIAHEKRRREDGGQGRGTRGWRGSNTAGPGVLSDGVEYDAKIVRDYDEDEGTIAVTIPNVRNGEGPFVVPVVPDETWLDEFELLYEGIYLRIIASQQGDTFSFRLAPDPYVQGGLIAVQPSTGRIVSIVSGYDFNDRSNRGQYLRAMQATNLQPGSAFKPMLMAAALSDESEGRWTMSSILKDEERQFGRDYTPSNFYNQFFGDVTMHYTLVHSLNAASVWLLDNLRPTRWGSVSYLNEFCTNNFDLSLTREEMNLTAALGSIGVSLPEMAQAYSVIANRGDFVKLHLVDRVYERKDERSPTTEPLYQFRQSYGDSKRMSPQVAYLVTHMLRDVFIEGTAAQHVEGVPFWMAGKTGTTNECTYAWFAGYTNDLLCIVYLGYDNPSRSLGLRMTGSRVALPVWVDFMTEAQEIVPEWFGEIEPPAGIEFHDICDLTGALAALECFGEKDRRNSRYEYDAVKTMPFIEGTAPTHACPMHGQNNQQIRPFRQVLNSLMRDQM